MKKLFLVTAALSALLLTGCGGRNALVSPVETADSVIPEGKAVITFYRSEGPEYATFQAPVIKEEKGGIKFIGAALEKKKIRDIVEPGEHTYVFAGENAQLLKARVAANKAYYVRIDASHAKWKADFTPEALRGKALSDPALVRTLKNAPLMQTNERGKQWAAGHQRGLTEKLAAGMRNFEEAPAKIQSRRILNPEDGIDTLY
jgi:hypothetical protein